MLLHSVYVHLVGLYYISTVDILISDRSLLLAMFNVHWLRRKRVVHKFLSLRILLKTYISRNSKITHLPQSLSCCRQKIEITIRKQTILKLTVHLQFLINNFYPFKNFNLTVKCPNFGQGVRT